MNMTQSSRFVEWTVITYLGLLNLATSQIIVILIRKQMIQRCKSTRNEVILHRYPRMLVPVLVDWRMQLDDEGLVLVSGQHLQRRSILNKCLWVRSGLWKQRV